jgi:hypothetical protein
MQARKLLLLSGAVPTAVTAQCVQRLRSLRRQLVGNIRDSVIVQPRTA